MTPTPLPSPVRRTHPRTPPARSTPNAKKRRTSSASAQGHAMSQPEFEKYLKVKWTHTIRTKATGIVTTYKGPNKDGHGLTLIDGHLRCSLCNVPIKQKKLTSQHLASNSHQAKFKRLSEAEVAPIPRLQQASLIELVEAQQQRTDLAGNTISEECRLYRAKALLQCYRANMSLDMLDKFSPLMDEVSTEGLTTGAASDLPRTVGKVVHNDEIARIREMLSGCFPQFGTISDATPIGAEAEAVKVRVVTRDYKILEPLVSVSLFDHKLNGENAANNLLTVIKDVCNLDPIDWRPAAMDRAATNEKALKDIKATTDYKPSLFPCLSHTISKPGEAFASPDAEKIRKAYNKSIMHRGKAFCHVRDLYTGVTPKIAAGVSWWNKWEQIDQLNDFALTELMQNYVPHCQTKKWSEKSIQKMSNFATPEIVPKAMVQYSAAAEVGRPLCQATYILEGDDPLALTAYRVLDGLDEFIGDGIKFKTTQTVCAAAADLISALRQPLLDDVSRLEESVTNASQAIATLEDSSSCEDDAAVQVSVARREQLTAARTRLGNVINELAAKKIELVELDLRLGPITTEEFLQLAHEVVQPAFEKYRDLFHKVVGPGEVMPDLVRVKRAFGACKLFDPFYLATEPRLEGLESLADELTYFEYPEFDEEFISELKKEIPEAIRRAKVDYDWENDATSKLYRNRVLARARREEQRIALDVARESERQDEIVPDVRETVAAAAAGIRVLGEGDMRNFQSWKDDAGERARRIWEWWRTWFNSHKAVFRNFSLALRLVVLAQPSSAATERVFSQVQYIRRICGNVMLGDMLSDRTIVRCNAGLTEAFDNN